MHRFDIFLVVAVIATAGEALSVAENLWDTASDLLTSSSSNEEAMAVQDVTDSGVYSPQEIIAEALCSAPSNDQSRKKQPSKFRRRQDCSPTRSRYKTSPPNAQEQGQQPHQTSSPDNKESNPSDAAANNAAAIDRSGFIDNFQLCNPLLVGKYREFPVCDSGKWQDRSMFRVRADTVNNVMVSGVYVLFDVMPVPFLYGCLGSSIAWCCETFGLWGSENLSAPKRLWASNCVAIEGVGVHPGETGPLVP